MVKGKPKSKRVSNDCVTRKEFDELKKSLDIEDEEVSINYITNLKKIEEESERKNTGYGVCIFFMWISLIASMLSFAAENYQIGFIMSMATIVLYFFCIDFWIDKRYWDTKYYIFKEFNKGE